MYQVSIEDIERSNSLSRQPGRTAFIDESGNFGFDFDNGGASLFYVVCAVIVKNENIYNLEAAAEKIRQNNGFQTGEMKSYSVGNNHKRRVKILTELVMLDFSIVLLIADKQSFFKDSPLSHHRDAFVKYLHQKLYDSMYAAYPKLRIVEDEYGDDEFQSGYRKYVSTHRPAQNLFNEYDFDYVNSNCSPLVQIADFIAGSISQHLLENSAPDALSMFQGKIRGQVNFPEKRLPYIAGTETDNSFDIAIYELAEFCATKYIDTNSGNTDEDIRLRVLFLRHLLFIVRNENPRKFLSSPEMTRILADLSPRKISRDFIYRKIIAPLRDSGVLISSCSHGYKIPVCIDDIYAYMNQTNGVVGPMLGRVEKCRALILRQTDGDLDIFNDHALVKYKRYFGDY